MSMSRCLGEDVEVRAGKLAGPDALEEPQGRGGMGHIGRLGFTRTAREHAIDTATDVGNYRAQIARFRKDLPLSAVVDYRPVHGGLVDRHVGEVVSNNGEDVVRAVEGGVGGIAILDE